MIGRYIHDKASRVVEVNCETDFVARNEKFTDLVKDLCLHIAASAPLYLSIEDVPEAERTKVATEFKEKSHRRRKAS